jgi:hypothetical protein
MDPILPDADAADATVHGFDCKNFVADANEIERFVVNHFDVVIVDGMGPDRLPLWFARDGDRKQLSLLLIGRVIRPR